MSKQERMFDEHELQYVAMALFVSKMRDEFVKMVLLKQKEILQFRERQMTGLQKRDEYFAQLQEIAQKSRNEKERCSALFSQWYINSRTRKLKTTGELIEMQFANSSQTQKIDEFARKAIFHGFLQALKEGRYTYERITREESLERFTLWCSIVNELKKIRGLEQDKVQKARTITFTPSTVSPQKPAQKRVSVEQPSREPYTGRVKFETTLRR